jgi:hypothetical protein
MEPKMTSTLYYRNDSNWLCLQRLQAEIAAEINEGPGFVSQCQIVTKRLQGAAHGFPTLLLQQASQQTVCLSLTGLVFTLPSEKTHISTESL